MPTVYGRVAMDAYIAVIYGEKYIGREIVSRPMMY